MRNHILYILKTAPESAAFATELAAMNEQDVSGNPADDPAGIAGSVIAGLSQFAHILGVDPIQFIREDDLSPLADLTAQQIVLGLDAIHDYQRDDNWNRARLIEMFFQAQLYRFHSTSTIGWNEIAKNLPFVRKYLEAAGSPVTVDEVQAAYENCSGTDDDSKLAIMKATASSEFVTGFIDAIRKVQKDNTIKNPHLANTARLFLKEHTTDREALDAILDAI